MKGVASAEWAAFLGEVKEAKRKISGSGPIWFRGQSDAGYDLYPSLLRYSNGLGKEQYLFNNFRKFAERVFTRRESEWETLFDMQHYLVPTRLLDWSETFGIALFFAAFYNSSQNDAALYLLNPIKLNEASGISEIYVIPKDEGRYSYSKIYWEHVPFFPRAPIAIEPIFINSRMSAQRGVFTVYNDSTKPIEKEFPDAISKIILHRELIPAAREFLELSNINEFSVFPDLGGISNFLKSTSGLIMRS